MTDIIQPGSEVIIHTRTPQHRRTTYGKVNKILRGNFAVVTIGGTRYLKELKALRLQPQEVKR